MSIAEAYDATEVRRQRGLAIAALSKIEKSGTCWVVPAQSGRGRYFVDVDRESPRCSCPDFEERGQPCKHVFAVQFVIGREKAPDDTETTTESVTITRRTVAERPTYKQNWPAYNAAQTQEKTKLQELVRDLCRGIDEPAQETGRPRLSLRDVVFACVFKVYSTVSGRRFMCDMADAHSKGFTSRPIHYNSIAKHMEMAGLTPILHRLITESSMPLRSVETEFAVDSTGFGTSRFSRWFDHKYGRPVQECDWVKCHAMTGVKTNVITAVEVSLKHDSDTTKFIPLLAATAKGFKIAEVSADKAYASRDNFNAADAIGGTAYIAFPANVTGGVGGLFAKMFHFYNFNRAEYLAHYHKRSNVETTFSMVKGKFGDSLRSKTDTALINEALCKILCHNVCCLIQSTYELGIEAKFWGLDEPAIVTLVTPDIDPLDAYSWM
jgi:transposase